MYYYYFTNNSIQGPVDLKALKALEKAGIIGQHTPIMPQGESDWRNLDDLFAAVHPQPPPPLPLCKVRSGSRVVAYMLDGIVAFVLVLAGAAIADAMGEASAPVVLAIGCGIIYLILRDFSFVGLGKRAVGIQLIDSRTHAAASPGKKLIKTTVPLAILAVTVVVTVIFGIGLFYLVGGAAAIWIAGVHDSDGRSRLDRKLHTWEVYRRRKQPKATH